MSYNTEMDRQYKRGLAEGWRKGIAEGKAQGIERELADMLGRWQGIPVTYAGGVGSFADLQELKKLGRDHIDVTIGSALDLFGGSMPYREVLRVCAANLDENS